MPLHLLWSGLPIEPVLAICGWSAHAPAIPMSSPLADSTIAQMRLIPGSTSAPTDNSPSSASRARRRRRNKGSVAIIKPANAGKRSTGDLMKEVARGSGAGGAAEAKGRST